MFSNLIDNAVRYGGGGARSLSDDATRLDRHCRGRGTGIPPDCSNRLSNRSRGSNPRATAETGGTGLGLSIARDIVLAHGGQISLANAPPGSRGLIVSVLLPKALGAST